MIGQPSTNNDERMVTIPSGRRRLEGILGMPQGVQGVVVFAHGSGSGRFSPRNQYVAQVLRNAGLATLLLDLLEAEEAEDRQKVFDIELLAERLQSAADWLSGQPETRGLGLGYFGASTGAAAALVAAARQPSVQAVVSRGGRPDLARHYLPAVTAPTLLIVGGNDQEVLNLNEYALELLRCPKQLLVIPGATHLFPEPGALPEVARLAGDWFGRHLRPVSASGPAGAGNPYGAQEVRIFQDREQAALLLAEQLKGRPFRDPLVLAIPRGGVVTGAVLARQLGAELDIVLSRKLRAPGHPEFAVGAVSEAGDIYINPGCAVLTERHADYLAQERRYQVAEIARRKKLFRHVRPEAPVSGRSVIVTDDGIATGSTMIAALQVVRNQNPHEVIVAVPVAPPERLAEIRRWCDEVVCLQTPPDFQAIGQFYEDFSQVEDERVLAILSAFAPLLADS